MKTLLLKFSGPLQSWGTSSHFETRYTDYHPSKSGVIGMIAASLGYRRDQDEEITALNDLDFGVRVDQRGTLLRDYHIARSIKRNGSIDKTYVTNRYYLEDGVFVVALGGEEEMIEKIEEGLKNPYFQPFFGKRSNPVNPDLIIGTTDLSVVDALEDLEWQARPWYKKCQREINCIELEVYVDEDLIEGPSSKFRRDRVKSFSQKHRQFDLRGEKMYTVQISEEHDAFMF